MAVQFTPELKSQVETLAQQLLSLYRQAEGRYKVKTASTIPESAKRIEQSGGRWRLFINGEEAFSTPASDGRAYFDEGVATFGGREVDAPWRAIAQQLSELTGRPADDVERLAANNRLDELTGRGSPWDNLSEETRTGGASLPGGAIGGATRGGTGFADQPAAQRQRATLINPATGHRIAVDVGSQEAQTLFGQGYVLEKAGEAPPKPATVVMPSGERVQVNVPDKTGKVVTPQEAFAKGAVLEEKPPDVPATLVKEGEQPKVIKTAEEAQKAFAEGFQLPEVTNLFQRDAEGNEGTIVKPPAPKVEEKPPEKKPEEKPPAPPPEKAPPAPGGEKPPATTSAPTTPETPSQPSTQTIVDGMLAGVDASVKKLITEMTEQFGATIAAWQAGEKVNEEELNKQFEELKTKNINPYFKQLITNYQTDLLHNIGVLTGQRAIELEGQKTEFENQTRQARATLEASGLSFSGEALRLLGAGAAFGQRFEPQGLAELRTTMSEPLQMTEIPEGQIPQSQRLIATSTRARQAERLRTLTTAAERELGSANIPAAFKLAGFGVPEGEPAAGEFLAGGQIGDVERQKREAELAGLEALRGVQTATRRTNALGQPI